MNQDKKNYNKLKRYWKLLLKDRSKVNCTNYSYHRSFKNLMREIDIIDYLLDLDPTLRASYELYHNIRSCIKMKDFARLSTLLYKKHLDICDYMKTSIQTMKKYIDYVENTLKYPYNNGVIEGINNKIKVIKRIAFGYKSFLHFKNRILITQNLANLKAV